MDDVFANVGMIPTAAQEKAQLMSGLSGELTRTLNSLPDVVDSKVQVVLPDNSPLADKSGQTPPTAAVLIQYRGQQPPLKESEVKNLTARAVEGLSPDNVAVVFKKVEIRYIPERALGPLPIVGSMSLNVLLEGLIGGLATLAGVGALVVLGFSKSQKLRIRKLEQQLAQRNTPEQISAVAKA